MYLYLLLPLPALVAYLFEPRLTWNSLLLVWAAVSIGLLFLMPIGSRDYTIYLRDFDDINALGLGELWRQDPLYTLAVWVFGHVGGTGATFYPFLASVALLVKLTALARLTGGSSLAVLLYMCSYFFLHEFTQIRAALAIGIWMHALVALNRSRFRYVMLTALASLIHIQAALGLLVFALLPLTRSRQASRVAGLVALLVVAAASTMLFDRLGYKVLAAIPDPRTQVYLALAAQDLWVRPNPFSVMSLLALGTALLGLQRRTNVQIRNGDATTHAVYLSLLLGSCALSLLSSISVAAFRVSEHFFALLPVGLWLAACRNRSTPRYPALLWVLAALFAYVFLFHSPYLLDPSTGEPNE